MNLRHIIVAAAIACSAGAAATVPADSAAARYSTTLRPAPADRLFRSEAVEAKIAEVKGLLTNAKLRWMFENCFPNTLDTTVHYRTDTVGGSAPFAMCKWLSDAHMPDVYLAFDFG